MQPDPNFMYQLAQMKMPFGRYQGWYVTDLPVHYLEWFAREGFPDGKLGEYLSTMYEVKINGLEEVLKPLIRERKNGYM